LITYMFQPKIGYTTGRSPNLVTNAPHQNASRTKTRSSDILKS
jgi:hypothetical protein